MLGGMSLPLTIRTARFSDLSAVDLLLARSHPRLLAADYPPSVMVTALPIISRARPELLASGRYYLAFGGTGQLLGAGGWSAAAPGPSDQVASDQAPAGPHLSAMCGIWQPIRMRCGRVSDAL